jgi:PIN domain nuclease of toxin-antitoxin system
VALLLDTCAAIWIVEEAKLADSGLEALRQAKARNEAIFVSPVTALEIGRLMSKGRVASPLSPKAWFRKLLSGPRVGLAELPPDVLIEASFLPGAPPSDPVDRILLASAREFGMSLLTRDQAILSYADAGHVQAIRC